MSNSYVVFLSHQAVRLESSWPDHVHYLVVVGTNAHQEADENILLGMDITTEDR